MAAPAFAFTISRAAEILGEDEQLLWDLADEMDPEDGCLWIHGTDDQQTIAFTPAGMEYLRDLLAEHKRNRPPRGTERMVSETWPPPAPNPSRDPLMAWARSWASSAGMWQA